ncbi:hypothetical protein [Streptomyces sp. NPDC059761]|uniref:hypothetical protein n=1 Tax=Streptomyces sp. NPDC059761 TaxID=3346937 RepID=UPI00365EA175
MSEPLDQNKAALQAQRVVEEISQEADAPLDVDIDPDRTRALTSSGLSRMRRAPLDEDDVEIQGIIAEAEGVIRRAFPGVFLLMNELWMVVRTPQTHERTGEIQLDMFGWPLWTKLPSGAYAEDYSRLTNREKDDFLLRITTLLAEWGQEAENLRGWAQFRKVRWEDAMADGFIGPTGRITVEERTHRGRAAASEERYRAVYSHLLSRKAERLVRDMELLGQRLKDSLTA